MNRFLFTMIAAFLALCTSNILACPGGYFKFLTFNDQVIGAVDVDKNTIRMTDPRAEITHVTYTASSNSTVHSLCEFYHPCNPKHEDLGGAILRNHPEAILLIGVRIDEVSTAYKVTNFSNSTGSCGELVPPSTKGPFIRGTKIEFIPDIEFTGPQVDLISE